MIIIYTYALYLAITLSVTVWVGKTLHKNGRAFLVDAFHGNESLADSVNQLLVIGFYLINIGYVCTVLKLQHEPTSLALAIELLSEKLGMVFLILGLMHCFNIFIFNSYRKSALRESADTPARASCTIESA